MLDTSATKRKANDDRHEALTDGDQEDADMDGEDAEEAGGNMASDAQSRGGKTAPALRGWGARNVNCGNFNEKCVCEICSRCKNMDCACVRCPRSQSCDIVTELTSNGQLKTCARFPLESGQRPKKLPATPPKQQALKTVNEARQTDDEALEKSRESDFDNRQRRVRVP